MRIDRRILYLAAITLTALTFTLTIIMIISTYRNMHLERKQMENSVTRKGISLLRMFEAAVCESDHAPEIAHIQQAAANVPNDEIIYIYMVDEDGKILIHSDLLWIGRQINGILPKQDETLTLRPNDTVESVMEVRRQCQMTVHTSINCRYIGIGLKTTGLERIYHEDRKHRMMMTAILILLGTATLFFILLAQNFYLVQRTLDRMKTYIQYVVESMANGLISLDADGIVTTINPAAAELIGVSIAQGLSFNSLFPEYADEIKSVLWDGSSILNREIDYQQPDGSIIPVSLSATQLRDNNGNKLGAVILLHDLREVRELYERARRAEHLASIGHMAATVAHEIRNPLSSIRGFAQYFAKLSQDKEEELAYATAMVKESDRLNLVVSELLNYARPLELDLEIISIEALFNNTVQMIKLETEKKDIEIIQEIEPDIPSVQLDPDRMLQVLLNLAQNSVTAMSDGGKLILQAAWLADQWSVQIMVQDTGSGIAKQNLPRLFEPFFTTKTHGTGLGLAIVRKIVDAHGGKIEVQSAENEGTRIMLILPQQLNAPRSEELTSHILRPV
jgi:two-component system sensor histidine kinase HydH